MIPLININSNLRLPKTNITTSLRKKKKNNPHRVVLFSQPIRHIHTKWQIQIDVTQSWVKLRETPLSPTPWIKVGPDKQHIKEIDGRTYIPQIFALIIISINIICSNMHRYVEIYIELVLEQPNSKKTLLTSQLGLYSYQLFFGVKNQEMLETTSLSCI